MEQLNRIELRGNVGSVRISETSAGRVARFSLATNYLYKTKDGEAAVETTWHNVVAWEGRNIPDVTKMTKGIPVYVCGRLRTSRYNGSDGTERSVFEVIATKLEYVEPE